MPEPESIANAPVDDLCDEKCAVCSVRYELDRWPCEVIGGAIIGRVICTPCLMAESAAMN